MGLWNHIKSIITGGGSRSLENPRVPLDPWSPLAESYGGGTSSSGIKVTREKALTYSAVWRCVNLVSRTVAKLPLGVYRNMDPGRVPDLDHKADFLLRCRPNDYMRPNTLKQVLTAHVLVQGNGYAYIARGGDGRPLQLLPLDPERTYPVREDGKLWYFHDIPGRAGEWIKPEDMLHLKGLGYDGLEGYSVLSMARESLGLGLATQRYGCIYFANSARPSVILMHPGRLQDGAKKKLRESWERLHGGLDNAHRTAILEEGVTVKELTINARDSQLIEGKQFSLIDVANWFHVPPHRVGSMVNVSYGSLEQENQSFADDGIEPWLVAWEEELEEKLLSDYGRKSGTHSIAFDRSGLVRPALAERVASYTQAIASGWMSPDEAREKEGLNPIEGGEGHQYFRPANLVPLDPDEAAEQAKAMAPAPAPVPGEGKTPDPKSAGEPAKGPKKAPTRKERFNPDQPREPDGKFGEGGGGGKDEGGKDDTPAASETKTMTVEQGDAWQREQYGDWHANTTQEQRDAASFYVSTGYNAVNYLLRDPSKIDPKYAQHTEGVEAAKVIDSMFATVPPLAKDQTVFRGVKLLFAKTLKGMKPGQEFTDKAFTSTTMAQAYTDKFKANSSNAIVAIHVPAGTKALPMSVFRGKEAELLLDRNSTFRVREVKDGVIHLDLVVGKSGRSGRATPPEIRSGGVVASEKYVWDEGEVEIDDRDDDGDRSAALAGVTAAILGDAYRRAVRRIAHQAERAAKKPGEVMAWLDEIQITQGNALAAEMRRPIEAHNLVTDGQKDAQKEANEFLTHVTWELLEASGRAKDAEGLAAEFAATLAKIEAECKLEG